MAGGREVSREVWRRFMDELLDEVATATLPFLRYAADYDYNQGRPLRCKRDHCGKPVHARLMCGWHYNNARRRHRIIDELRESSVVD